MTIITNKREYHLVMSQIETFLQKGFDALAADEENTLEELSKAAEGWELNEYPMPLKPALTDILIFIMYQKNLNQSELSKTLEISSTSLSEILSGKKKPNLEIVKQLHRKFQVDGNVILDSVL
jgi:HTH-type transcriptional regulator/antitoxin HigA